MTDTVKAREHYGANSLDITIPSEEVRNYNINPGDIFEFKIESEDGELVLTYERVYRLTGRVPRGLIPRVNAVESPV